MAPEFLLYGATGFVGRVMARRAVAQGLRPVVAGRDARRLAGVADALGLPQRTFALDDADAMDAALSKVPAVLHCAGPYLHTARPMVDACLRTGTHYLDISGEVPVYAETAGRDPEARARGVMLLPGAGFDVAPTDCLAVHLKRRLPSATHLTLAFHNDGPVAFPPGTVKTMFELMPLGDRVRLDGKLVAPRRRLETRRIDFGNGPREATRVTWGDVFTAYRSTGIPNIETYMVMSATMQRQLAMLGYVRPLFRIAAVRGLMGRMVRSGSTEEQRARTRTSVWGEVTDDEGRAAAARLRGPEASVEWTTLTALAAVRRVLAGDAPAGYQTPATAFGADFALASAGVTREDVR